MTSDEKRLRVNQLEKERRDRLKRLSCELNQRIYGPHYKKTTFKQTLDNAKIHICSEEEIETKLSNEKEELIKANLQLKKYKEKLIQELLKK